jgi:hypothetical protein
MRTRIPRWVIVMIFGAPFLLMCIICSIGRNPNHQPSLQIGQQARLHRTDGGDDPPAFLVAADAEALSQCISAVNAGDPYGTKELVAAGRLWLVPAGTSVVVLELAFFSRKVRILEGEHQGKAGWIPTEFVAP